MMNVTLAAIGIVVLAPLMVLIALLVKATSPGPVIYVQQRVGLDRRGSGKDFSDRRRIDLGGRQFNMYKFRTMAVGAELATGAVWATPDDPRVTSVGRHLRRYRLDELPQLFNVLRGDMNLVGPRPERPSIFAELRERLPEYPERQRAMPGITGLAQIRHHYDLSIDDVAVKLGFDLDYVRRQSAWLDLQIILLTVPSILLGRKGW